MASWRYIWCYYSTPINILFGGGGKFWPLIKIKMMIVMMVVMMMMIMMMIMTMMIMTIVSVEQRPGWGEHVFIEFWTLISSIQGLCTASELRGHCTCGNLQNVYQITYSSGHSHRAPNLIMCKPLQTKDCAKMVKFADKATSKKYSKYKTPMEYVILLVNYVCICIYIYIYIHIISYPMCAPLFVPKTTSQSQIHT